MARRNVWRTAAMVSMALVVAAVESGDVSDSHDARIRNVAVDLGHSEVGNDDHSTLVRKNASLQTGVLELDSGSIDYFIPDGEGIIYGLRNSSVTPQGAVTTKLEYRLRISDEGNGEFYCGDYIVFLMHSFGTAPAVYYNLGGLTDGGYDDDPEDDADIEINWRFTSFFNGLSPRMWWKVCVLDSYGGPYGAKRDGQLNYIQFRVHWEMPPPSISIGNESVTEGHFGTTLAEFAISLSSEADDTVSVDWSTRDGTADSADYAPTSGAVSFAPGETSKNVTVVVFGDTEEEADEIFYVDLSNPSNAPIDDGQGRCTILDDDGPLFIYDQTGNESGWAAPVQDFETEMDDYDSEAADDFVVPDGGWRIDTVELWGVYSDGSGPAEGVNLWFYSDDGGWPSSSAVCSYSEVVPTSDGASEGSFGMIVVDLPTACVLGPGRHWLATQARMDYSAGGQFYWSQRTTLTGYEGVWRQPGDGDGWGFTTWTRLTEVVPNSNGPDLSFRLIGATKLPRVFADGFESGDCSAWSAEVP